MLGQRKYFDLELLRHNFQASQLAGLMFALYWLIQYPISAPFVHGVVFYACVVPSVLYLLWQQRFLARALHLALWPAALLVLYCLLHVLILRLDGDGLPKTLVTIGASYLFILAATLFFSQEMRCMDQVLRAIVFVASLAAAASVISFMIHVNGTHNRLIPLGRANHEVLGASVYAGVALVALYLFRKDPKDKLAFIGLLLAGMVVVFTQSRMPIFALGVSALFFMATTKANNIRFVVSLSIIGLCIVLSTMMVSVDHWLLDRLIAAKDGYSTNSRVELWSAAIDAIWASPWYGYGLRAPLQVQGINYTPHNIYVSTAFFLGIPAFILLIVLIVHAWRASFKSNSQPDYRRLVQSMMVLGLICCLTDHAQLMKGPSPLWIIFWLPLCMAWGLSLHEKRKAKE